MADLERFAGIVEKVVSALNEIDNIADLMPVIATSIDTWASAKKVSASEVEKALDIIARLAPIVHVIMEDGR